MEQPERPEQPGRPSYGPTVGERLAAQARALLARRTADPGWRAALAPVLARGRSLPVPQTSPRRRTEVRVPPVGHESPPAQLGWPDSVNTPASWPASRPAPAPDASRHEGSPLRGDLRERLAPVVGPDVDRVRVHDDEQAATIAAAHGADAVTLGEDVFLGGPRATRPERLALLAHEVWHATEPGRTGGAPHRATASGAAEEERAALAVESEFLHGPAGVRVPGAPPHEAAGRPPSPAVSPPSTPVPAPPSATGSSATGTAAHPMTARPDRHSEPPSQALDPQALRDVVREVLRGELRDGAARQLRADLAIELERGA
ncbi:DUF4157 domain-containing protein [Streptomyces aquilus]|uniref:DUF4157 domain-containing protein n=1 Tax=Streptomyces aquilus TaxID=2548456 RepID=A0A3S9HUS9_9ACTN|nr:DUF4157 domain-containing protein [Streptomyces aquilus]AZP15878.1 DUF4157 domain-containing protein [Streptomyces aquilus]